MLYFAVAIGLLSFFSSVSTDPPTKNDLITEVDKLLQVIGNIVEHIDKSATARIDDKIAVVDKCWTVKTDKFLERIKETYQEELSSLKTQLTQLYQNVPKMDSDQIAKLSQQLYVQTGGLLEKSEEAVDQFNQKVTGIHKEVLALNSIDC